MATKDMGCLGVGSLKALYIALMTKCWWRVKTETRSIWRSVIVALHGFHRSSQIDPFHTKKIRCLEFNCFYLEKISGGKH